MCVYSRLRTCSRVRQRYGGVGAGRSGTNRCQSTVPCSKAPPLATAAPATRVKSSSSKTKGHGTADDGGHCVHMMKGGKTPIVMHHHHPLTETGPGRRREKRPYAGGGRVGTNNSKARTRKGERRNTRRQKGVCPYHTGSCAIRSPRDFVIRNERGVYDAQARQKKYNTADGALALMALSHACRRRKIRR